MALNVVSNAGPFMVFSNLNALALLKNVLLCMDEKRGRDYAMQKNLYCFDSVYSGKEVLWALFLR